MVPPPLVTVKVTATPETGMPLASVTRTAGAWAAAKAGGPVWLVAETATIWVGRPPAARTAKGAVPLTPSQVAWMVDVPTATAVTRPEVETVATEGVSELQVKVLPAMATPFASRATAVASVVWPTPRGVVTVTVTVETGSTATVTVAEPLCPSLVAMMLAVPVATPVTAPEAETVATEVADEDQ